MWNSVINYIMQTCWSGITYQYEEKKKILNQEVFAFQRIFLIHTNVKRKKQNKTEKNTTKFQTNQAVKQRIRKKKKKIKSETKNIKNKIKLDETENRKWNFNRK